MHEHPGASTDPAGSGSDASAPPMAGHSMWAMVACCAPMILIVLAVLFGWFGR